MSSESCRRLVDLGLGVSHRPSASRGPRSCPCRIVSRVAVEGAIFAIHLIQGFARFIRSITYDGSERYAFWAMGTRDAGDLTQGLE